MDENQQGNGLPSGEESGQTSEAGKVTTPTPVTPKTYSEAEKNKAVSDALAAAGRTAKDFETREASIKASEESFKSKEEELNNREKALDEQELVLARQDPARLKIYQDNQAKKIAQAEIDKQRKQLQADKDALNRDKAEHAAEVKLAKDTLTEIALWQIGEKYGVDPSILKDLNLPSVEQAEAVAKRLATKRPATSEGEPATATAQAGEPFSPDSGMTSGSTGKLTPEQFEKLSIEQKKAYLEKQNILQK